MPLITLTDEERMELVLLLRDLKPALESEGCWDNLVTRIQALRLALFEEE